MNSQYNYMYGRLRQLGMTQEDVARRLGLPRAAVSHRFCGRTPWRLDEMYDMLKLMDAKPEELHRYFPPNAGCLQRGETIHRR